MTIVHSLADLEGEPHARVFADSEPKTIRLTLEAGEEMPRHSHPDRQIVCYLVSGTIELRVDEESDTLTAGDIARFDGDHQISPRAIEDSTALLVLAPRANE